jgi:hypothetical protein
MAQQYTPIKGVEGPGIPRQLPEEMIIEGGEAQMPSLPSLNEADPLTLLQGLMGEIGPLAQRKARAKGMEEMWGFAGKRGITPSDLPGSTVANMINVMDRAMTDPVVDKMEQMNNMLQTTMIMREENRKIATNQVEYLMSSGEWNKLLTQKPEDAEKLWESAGFIGGPYAINPKKDWQIQKDNNGDIYRISPDTGEVELLARFGGDEVPGEVGTGFDLNEYFSPSELREIRSEGIDPNTKKGFEAAQEMFPPERDKWNSADDYIDENIRQGAVSSGDMAEIFSNLTRPAPDGAGLGSTEAKTLMAQRGMLYDSTIGWTYMP